MSDLNGIDITKLDLDNPIEVENAKNTFSSIKEVERLQKMVEEQQALLMAMWYMLRSRGATNEEYNEILDKVVMLLPREDYTEDTVCPNCGKGMQKLEKYLFKKKCYYCGYEITENPYVKYDNMDPEGPEYKSSVVKEEQKEQQEKEAEELNKTEEEKAREILNTTFEPYDVSQDLKFDEE